jgi:signal transduction histidine kinase/CheY-like chemotaxis protein
LNPMDDAREPRPRSRANSDAAASAAASASGGSDPLDGSQTPPEARRRGGLRKMDQRDFPGVEECDAGEDEPAAKRARVGDEAESVDLVVFDDSVKAAYGILDAPIWVQERTGECFFWINAAGLRLWRAESLEELRARRVHADPSPANIANLDRMFSLVPSGLPLEPELKTYYPKGQTVTTELRRRGVRLLDGRIGVLTEVKEIFEASTMIERNVAALFGTPFLLSFFDQEGRVLQLNPAAEAIAHTPPLGFFDRFIDPQVAESVREDLKLNRHAQCTAEVSARHGSVWHDIDARICSDGPAHEVILVSETDVTALKEAELAQTKLKEAAQDANAAKVEFLGNVSHELRTPLFGILGMAELLEPHVGRGDAAEILDDLRRSGEALYSLIHDILDMARLEAGEVEIRPAPFIVADILATCVSEVDAARDRLDELPRSSVPIVTEISESLPRALVSDPRRIQQVAKNLLTNALKFTDTGQITLRAERVGEDRWCISVNDTGQGIPNDKLELIFERFARIRTDKNSRNLKGVGLGLSISHELASRLGGSLTVESEIGSGSTFAMTLPMEEPEQASLASLPESSTSELATEAGTEAPGRSSSFSLLLSGGSVSSIRPSGPSLNRLVNDMNFPEDIPVSSRIGDRLQKQRSGRDIPVPRSGNPSLSDGESSATTGDEAEYQPPAGPRPRVLVVDDARINRALISRALQPLAVEVDLACDGQEGLDLLSSQQYALVITDVNMPNVSGLELIERVRAGETSNTNIVILVASADATSSDRARYLETGADACVPKPLQLRTLTELAVQCLR